jgi:hypothetical protein
MAARGDAADLYRADHEGGRPLDAMASAAANLEWVQAEHSPGAIQILNAPRAVSCRFSVPSLLDVGDQFELSVFSGVPRRSEGLACG